MARIERLTTTIVDDLDGTHLDESDATTVEFGLDGVAYEIELSSKNAQSLRADYTAWIEHARKISVRSTGSKKVSRPTSSPAAGNTGEIRAWAKKNGVAVSERGRIAATVIAAFESAH